MRVHLYTEKMVTQMMPESPLVAHWQRAELPQVASPPANETPKVVFDTDPPHGNLAAPILWETGDENSAWGRINSETDIRREEIAGCVSVAVGLWGASSVVGLDCHDTGSGRLADSRSASHHAWTRKRESSRGRSDQSHAGSRRRCRATQPVRFLEPIPNRR